MTFETLHSKLEEIVGLLNEFHDLTNCHLVNFITKRLFENLLPEQLRNELLSLSDDQLNKLPSGCADLSNRHQLKTLLGKVVRLTLPNVLEDSNLLMKIDKNASRLKFNHYMSLKKSHEVDEMTSTIGNLAAEHNIHCVVDIGSGKGYLSSLLAMQFGLKVYGFDASDGNTQGAQKRQNNVEKHWKGFVKKCANDLDTSDNQTVTTVRSGSYVPVTCTIDQDTDLNEVLALTDQKVIICGLHTCGDLASSAISIFCRNEVAKILCVVGCCYHLIEEEFAINPYRRTSDKTKYVRYGFPMSTFLKRQRFSIGRNGRILACQPLARLADQSTQLFNKSLFWRALLQQIIWDKSGEVDALEYQVGKIASKSDNFLDYVRKAFDKLKLQIDITDEEISNYEQDFAAYEQRMKIFCVFRCLFAPVIETVIILDKLNYLLEKEDVECAHIVQLFDPIISPRCFALLAKKI